MSTIVSLNLTITSTGKFSDSENFPSTRIFLSQINNELIILTKICPAVERWTFNYFELSEPWGFSIFFEVLQKRPTSPGYNCALMITISEILIVASFRENREETFPRSFFSSVEDRHQQWDGARKENARKVLSHGKVFSESDDLKV